MLVRIRHPEKLVYPETDGEPMGENTVQVKWIIELFNGLQAAFKDRPDAFVAANLFWFPVHGDPTTVLAPDIMVALGRPKGDRPSYKQWQEGGVAPHAVFEVLSPSNTADEMAGKRKFFRRYGAMEYYEYDPYKHVLKAWTRSGKRFVPVPDVNGFISPALGIRFVARPSDPMTVFGPDGRRFRPYLELLADADAHQQRIVEERTRADKLAAKLRELGVDPDAV